MMWRTGGDGGTGGLRIHGVNADGGVSARLPRWRSGIRRCSLLHADAHGTGAVDSPANVDNGRASAIMRAARAMASVAAWCWPPSLRVRVTLGMPMTRAFGGERVAQGRGGYRWCVWIQSWVYRTNLRSPPCLPLPLEG